MLKWFHINLQRSRHGRSSWRIPVAGRGRECGRWRSRGRGWCARRLAQVRLELGDGLLDRVEVGAVGREEQQLRSRGW